MASPTPPPLLLRSLLALCLLALTAAAAPETVTSATPSFGVVNVTWTPSSDAADNDASGSGGGGGATLVLYMAAATLGKLPLNVGRTQLTLLAEKMDIPEARCAARARARNPARSHVAFERERALWRV
jgi:hypothetical protein